MDEPAPNTAGPAADGGAEPRPGLLKRAFLRCDHRTRYGVSLLLFWPTCLGVRLRCALSTSQRLFTRITPHVILGAVPLTRASLIALSRSEHVRGIVNLCREFDWHGSWYSSAGMRQLWLPTIDYDTPAFSDCVAGANFISDCGARGETAYTHCKAGKGRSTTIVLAFLVLYRGMTPEGAHAHVKAIRPQISEKYTTHEIQRCWQLRQELDAGRLEMPEFRELLAALALPGSSADATSVLSEAAARRRRLH